MNNQPIEAARDADLRLSVVAMLRAAQRARELARQTATEIVISEQGVVQKIKPPAASPDQLTRVQDSAAAYRGKT